jgi:transcriptional regulator with XRE-family HTH domain
MWTAERIKALRERYGEKQEEFCHRLGVGVGTLRHWEQGRGTPSGPAAILLGRIEEDIMPVNEMRRLCLLANRANGCPPPNKELAEWRRRTESTAK